MPGSTGGSWKRSDWSGSPKWDNPTGNRGHQGFWTYRQNHAAAPAPDPTQDSDRTGALRHRVRECGRGFAGVRVVTVQRSPSPVVEVPRCVLTTGWVGESHVGVVSTPSRYLV